MRAKKNILTINGRIYDTVTGRVVGGAAEPKTTSKLAATHPAKHPHPTAKARKIEVKHAVNRDGGQAAIAVHVKTERSKTLRRHGLSKPASSRAGLTVAGLAKQPKHHMVGHAIASPKQDRLLKGHGAPKFPSHSLGVKHKTTHLPVKSAPSTHSHAKHGYSISDTPPSPVVNSAPKKPSSETNIFEAALASATSHQTAGHQKSKSTKRRLGNVGALLIAVILLTGFFAYQNAPKIALAQATPSIGFKAGVPKYQPVGFGMNRNIQYQPGLVLINVRSNSDDRAYTITQTKSTFDNFALADKLDSSQKPYFATDVNGHAVYISSSKATWVLHDILYTIENNANLSTDQLTKIAASI